MRIFAFVTVLFFSLAMYTSTAYAACPTGCFESAGNCYSNTTAGACASQITPPSTGTTLINPLGPNANLMSFLLSILSIITDTIGPVIVILMLVYVGYKFVVAQGNPAKIEEAKGMLLWTVVGALILLGAKVIAMGIQATVQALSTG